MRKTFFTVALCAVTAWSAPAQIRLNRIFGDHAVLQRGKQLAVWGEGAKPRGKVVVKVGLSSCCTLANDDGTFLARVPAQKEGGPYTLVAEDVGTGGKAVSSDVYIGEVWVASGQSNMGFRMHSAVPAFPEGEHPLIRMLMVPHKAVTVKVREVEADWQVATPQNVGGFSAVGGFFALELQKRLGCAVGVFDASWGGTRVEAWTSREALLSDPVARPWVMDYERSLSNLDFIDKAAATLRHNHEPENRAPLDPGIDPKAAGWAAAVEPESGEWRDVNMPASFETSFKRLFNGAVWFRRTVELPAEFAGRELELSVGRIDKQDRTFFNGEQVGATGTGREVKYWNQRRVYKIPARLAKAGRAVVAVRVWSQIHAGAMSGPEEDMYIAVAGDASSKRIELCDAKWRARVERDIGFTFKYIAPPISPGSPNAPHTLFDGMISPLLGCSIRGAIWYQGESNASTVNFAQHYGELMTLMIRDWRNRWGQGDFPFIQVELANFGNPREFQEMCHWSEVRQGQVAATRALPNSGIASAVDIGDAMDIHPRDKKTLGARLARWAFANVYSLETVGCGPRYLSSEVEGAAIRVRFTDCGSGLVAKGSPAGEVKPCYIAGRGGDFVPATGRIDGQTLVISSPKVKNPVMACYGWAANPKGLNLYNREGLPASPFMTAP
ncbi:MAG: hypothetical protein J6T01_01295 [Kiritimatiellae bacterium]|nr:hypothetical protein [Kiritimatiellia bacterium]